MTTEPSEKTKALLEKTRAAKAAEGEQGKTVTIVEDANLPTKDKPPVPEPEDNSALLSSKRAADKLAAEQARGQQVIARHQDNHKRAVAAQKASDEANK